MSLILFKNWKCFQVPKSFCLCICQCHTFFCDPLSKSFEFQGIQLHVLLFVILVDLSKLSEIVVFINCVFCKHLLCKIDIQNKIHVNDAARSKSIIQDIKSTINDKQKSYQKIFSVHGRDGTGTLIRLRSTGICSSIPDPKGQGIRSAVVLANLKEHID